MCSFGATRLRDVGPIRLLQSGLGWRRGHREGLPIRLLQGGLLGWRRDHGVRGRWPVAMSRRSRRSRSRGCGRALELVKEHQLDQSLGVHFGPGVVAARGVGHVVD